MLIRKVVLESEFNLDKYCQRGKRNIVVQVSGSELGKDGMVF